MIKLFTDWDLDGTGCAIVGKVKHSHIDIEYLNPNKINKRIEEFLDNLEYKIYSSIYITDLSVNQELAERIEEINSEKNNFKLFDHHQTALELNKFKWCSVIVENEINKECGTSLFYKYLFGEDSSFKTLSQFVELVRKYDTYEWVELNDKEPNRLNDLYFLIGRDKFIEEIFNILLGKREFELNNIYETILDAMEDKKKHYFEKKNEKIKSVEFDGFTIGIVNAEKYLSELGNYLSMENPQYDFIAIVNDDKISYRTVKDNIDVSKFAQRFGGGGHPKASGNLIKEEIQNERLRLLFS